MDNTPKYTTQQVTSPYSGREWTAVTRTGPDGSPVEETDEDREMLHAAMERAERQAEQLHRSE